MRSVEEPRGAPGPALLAAADTVVSAAACPGLGHVFSVGGSPCLWKGAGVTFQPPI